MKDKIVCLVGASGSGKTTIAKELEGLGYNIIHSYTTREPRHENEWGHTFIDGQVSNSNTYIATDQGTFYPEEMIAYKELYGEHYFATYKQYQGKGTSIYVVDPEGAEQVRENIDDFEVITIFLMVDRDNRYRRLHRRKDVQCSESIDLPKEIDEIWSRLNADRKTFKICKCDYVIDANRPVDKVLEGVVEIIG